MNFIKKHVWNVAKLFFSSEPGGLKYSFLILIRAQVFYLNSAFNLLKKKTLEQLTVNGSH